LAMQAKFSCHASVWTTTGWGKKERSGRCLGSQRAGHQIVLRDAKRLKAGFVWRTSRPLQSLACRYAMGGSAS